MLSACSVEKELKVVFGASNQGGSNGPGEIGFEMDGGHPIDAAGRDTRGPSDGGIGGAQADAMTTAGGHGGAIGLGGEGGGMGGSVGFFLPANPRIMPLGDSITFGTGYDAGGGYRAYLWTALPTIQPVGTVLPEHLVGLVGKDLCEGHPGYDATQLALGIRDWLTQSAPVDAILLHACTNSIGAGEACTAGITSIYEAMIALNPDAILFVADPIVSPELVAGDPTAALFEASLAGISASLASMPRAIPVAMPSLEAGDYWDYWHPNSQGYRKMADAWAAALTAAGAL
jgi:hypothetical protein